jgi:hypothetical protein
MGARFAFELGDRPNGVELPRKRILAWHKRMIGDGYVPLLVLANGACKGASSSSSSSSSSPCGKWSENGVYKSYISLLSYLI